jgi:hypothetical protein
MAPSFGGQAKQVEVLAARIAANLKGFRQKFSDIQERAMACTENTSVQTYTQDERSIKTRVDKYMDIILPVAALAVMCLQCLGKKIEVK